MTSDTKDQVTKMIAKKLKSQNEQNIQLEDAKSKFKAVLNKLIFPKPYTTALPSNIHNNIPFSLYDNSNDYINKNIQGIDKFNDSKSINFISTLTSNLENITIYRDIILTSKSLDEFNEYSSKYYDEIYHTHNALIDYFDLYAKFSGFTFDAISSCITDVEQELTKFKRLRGIADTALTESIYDSATQKYERLAKKYQIYFYCSLAIILSISVISVFLKPLDGFSATEFWLIKASILFVGIFLISYFLKQSSHYQKLADQSYQTQVELQALPSFIANISNQESAELIRKELALKYFGKDVDGTPHKDLSNLITDQMKSTTELVKATASMIKKQ